MTADLSTNIRASRVRVPRTRGALSGFLLVLLGAWAALIPFVGPYFNFAFTPDPNAAWHWTSARGGLEVAPGVAVAVGGLLLLFSASRVVTSFGAWLAAAGGAWLIVSPALDPVLKVDLGTPDPASNTGVRVLEDLLFFYALGAVILFLASVALGRLSVHSVRDVRAAERRAMAEEAAAAEQQRAFEERRAAEAEAEERVGRHQERQAQDRAAQERVADERSYEEGRGAVTQAPGSGSRTPDPATQQAPPAGYPQGQPQGPPVTQPRGQYTAAGSPGPAAQNPPNERRP
jgi:hypothetical protein